MEPKGLSRVQGPIMSQMNPAHAVIPGNLKYILILGTYSTYARAKILYRQHLSPPPTHLDVFIIITQGEKCKCRSSALRNFLPSLYCFLSLIRQLPPSHPLPIFVSKM